MKKFTAAIFGMTILLTQVFAQAAWASALDSRYIFEDLEELEDFNTWGINGWQVLDSRSLIVNISPSRPYLLILDRNVSGLRSVEHIRISSINSRVLSGIDRVQVLDNYSRPARIEKIYLLPDRASRQNAREVIRAR